jgi:ABC-type branched-subunit amino acid transport system permease subunit
VAIPAIRLSGVYLAIATFGFGLVVQRIFYSSFLMFGGTFAVRAPRPRLDALHTHTDVGYYHVVLAITVACCVLVVVIRRSRIGRLLRGFADSPTAIDAHGTNTNQLKVLVFCLSAFLAGIGGGLLGPVTGTASAGSGIAVGGFDFTVSLLLISVLFVAGRQPILSAVLGSGLLIIAPGYLSGATAQKLTPVIFGTLAVAAAMFGGRSLVGMVRSSTRVLARAAQDGPIQVRRRRLLDAARPALEGAQP